MSGIARVLLARGIEVSGSDAKDSRRLQALKPLGGKVFVGHDADNLLISGTQPSCVVISTAIGQDNPEVVKATELGIPVVSRAIALAELLENTTAISVAGTHGKTTTTSMVTVILQNAGQRSFLCHWLRDE
jgi:UDP-N-acetylmuramate--alanine ligase